MTLQDRLPNGIDRKTQRRRIKLKDFLLLRVLPQRLAIDQRLIHHARDK